VSFPTHFRITGTTAREVGKDTPRPMKKAPAHLMIKPLEKPRLMAVIVKDMTRDMARAIRKPNRRGANLEGIRIMCIPFCKKLL
jgi:hypothetical protein